MCCCDCGKFLTRHNLRRSLSWNIHPQTEFLKYDGNTCDLSPLLRLCHQRRSTPSLRLWRVAVKTTDWRVTAVTTPVLLLTFCPREKSTTTGETVMSLSFCSWMLHQFSPAEDSKISESVFNGGTQCCWLEQHPKVEVYHSQGYIVFCPSDLLH